MLQKSLLGGICPLSPLLLASHSGNCKIIVPRIPHRTGPVGFYSVHLAVSAIPGPHSPGDASLSWVLGKEMPRPACRAAGRSGPSPPGAPGSCSQRCGDRDGSCSCHPTCSGLSSCCSDFRDFCLEISPYSGSMMGGKDFVVQHLNWFRPTEGVICRWEARGALWLLGTQGQLAAWGLPTQAPPFLPPATLSGLRRVSRPSDMWIPLDVCTVCPPCCMRQAASPSHSPWTMVAPFHAPGPGWLVSPALLSLGRPTGNYPRHASPASPPGCSG